VRGEGLGWGGSGAGCFEVGGYRARDYGAGGYGDKGLLGWGL